LSWLQRYVPMLIAAVIACAVCTLFLFQSESSVLWGLIASAMVAAAMVVCAAVGICFTDKSTVDRAYKSFL